LGMIQPVSVGSGMAAWMDANVQRERLQTVAIRLWEVPRVGAL